MTAKGGRPAQARSHEAALHHGLVRFTTARLRSLPRRERLQPMPADIGFDRTTVILAQAKMTASETKRGLPGRK
jgi:hypothetical protein